MSTRLRRLRTTPRLREAVAETRLSPEQLIQPHFVLRSGGSVRLTIPSVTATTHADRGRDSSMRAGRLHNMDSSCMRSFIAADSLASAPLFASFFLPSFWRVIALNICVFAALWWSL